MDNQKGIDLYETRKLEECHLSVETSDDFVTLTASETFNLYKEMKRFYEKFNSIADTGELEKSVTDLKLEIEYWKSGDSAMLNFDEWAYMKTNSEE